jgi:hypothetical protein
MEKFNSPRRVQLIAGKVCFYGEAEKMDTENYTNPITQLIRLFGKESPIEFFFTIGVRPIGVLNLLT